jgi:malate permease and related proteins
MAFDAFLLILVMLVVGMLAARSGVFANNAAEVLNRFVLYVCLPAAVLKFAPRLQFDLSLLGLIAVPWIVLLVSAAAVHALARLLRFSEGERAVLLLCVPLGNTSFLGYPLVQAMLGDAALPHAVVYDQFGSFLILSSWGLWVLARYGGDAPPRLRDIGLRVLRFPPFLALLLALSVMPAEPPAPIAALLSRLADALLPVVAMAVGLSVRLRLPREELAPLASGLVLKLLLMPALAWLLLPVLGLAGVQAQTAVLETAMPPMITAGALAISHGLAPRLAAALVGYGIVLSLISLPLWHALLS